MPHTGDRPTTFRPSPRPLTGSTVRSVLAASGLVPVGAVPWGTPLPSRQPGVYVVATTGDPDDQSGSDRAVFSEASATELLDICRNATVDDRPVTVDTLMARLGRMWVPGQPVVYIGTATDLRKRVGQFYRTRLGASAPHAGGWPLKMLANLAELTVHYAECAGKVAADLRRHRP